MWCVRILVTLVRGLRRTISILPSDVTLLTFEKAKANHYWFVKGSICYLQDIVIIVICWDNGYWVTCVEGMHFGSWGRPPSGVGTHSSRAASLNTRHPQWPSASLRDPTQSCPVRFSRRPLLPEWLPYIPWGCNEGTSRAYLQNVTSHRRPQGLPSLSLLRRWENLHSMAPFRLTQGVPSAKGWKP